MDIKIDKDILYLEKFPKEIKASFLHRPLLIICDTKSSSILRQFKVPLIVKQSQILKKSSSTNFNKNTVNKDYV